MTIIRTILAPLLDSVADEPLLKTAFKIGQSFKAHVRALSISPDIDAMPPRISEGMSADVIREAIERSEKEVERKEQEGKRIRVMFDRVRNELGIPIADRPSKEDQLTASWSEASGVKEEIVASRGRLFDLVMLRKPDIEHDDHAIPAINAAVMNTGRPLLLVPPVTPALIGRHVAIAWNGSSEAIRAVSAAMPFLFKADRITILTASESSDSRREDAIEAEEFASYLGWHRLTAETREFAASTSEVGEMLMAKALEYGADMLVMGAYTHGMLHNLIFGGATRHMLRHLTIPVLMRH